MSIRTFALVITFCMGAGAAIGAGLMRDPQERPPAPPGCVVRSDWDGNASTRYGFALMTGGDDKIGRFDSLDGAIEAAGKIGCKILP